MKLLLTLLIVSAACAFGTKNEMTLNDPAMQARSVHLYYMPQARAPESAMATIRVTEVQTNSYYMALGWDCGYCGLQDAGGRRIFLFSVWEPSDYFDLKAREEDVHEDIRARAVFVADGVKAERFGGEGTGMKTTTDLRWVPGDDVTVRIDSAPDGDDRMVFSCSIQVNGGAWWKIASISTVCPTERQRCVHNIHSFVEDFWRNGVSTGLSRRAEYRSIKTRAKGSDEWVEAKGAMFTADATDTNNIDAGPTGDGGCFLMTGGGTTNASARLWHAFKFEEVRGER